MLKDRPYRSISEKYFLPRYVITKEKGEKNKLGTNSAKMFNSSEEVKRFASGREIIDKRFHYLLPFQ